MTRRAYIDWLRGLAVVVMFMAHATDAWSVDEGRDSVAFMWRTIISGFAAPLFLLLAGTAVAYAAGSRVARGAPDARVARDVAARGWQIFGIAFLFRLWMYVAGGFYRWQSLLKVDVLNIMGPAIAGAAYVWGLAQTSRGKMAVLLVPTVGLPFATPYIRGFSGFAPLPDPIEAYIRPAGGYAAFTLFPWAAFVFVGALVGVILRDARDRTDEARRVALVTLAGVLLAAGAWTASFYPSPFPNSSFWSTSPAFFFLRSGIMLALFGVAWIWSERLWAGQWQPFVLLGQTSLFVYWVHVEVVYGYLTKPLYHRMPLWLSFAALVPLTIAMYYLARHARAWLAHKRTEGITDWRTRALTIMGL